MNSTLPHRTHWPRYDWRRTYDWNHQQRPQPAELAEPVCSGSWRIAGREMPSPLGVAAGPLLHGHWILYYASLGFDLLTYKTVRSRPRSCYELPNLQPVRQRALRQVGQDVPSQSRMRGTWAVSFGMPSQSPDMWRQDVRWTRQRLSREKLLSVSVVASVQPDWSLEDVAQDYARCAGWAVECGADLVEINLSCPNVETCDGQLYQQPEQAAVVARMVKSAIAPTPLLAKIGYLPEDDGAISLLTAIGLHVDALVLVNGFSAHVRDATGQRMFGGQQRGICGRAMREVSLSQLARLHRLKTELQLSTELIGVGGIFDAGDVRDFLAAGASTVQLATAPMLDPLVAFKLRREMG